MLETLKINGVTYWVVQFPSDHLNSLIQCTIWPELVPCCHCVVVSICINFDKFVYIII